MGGDVIPSFGGYSADHGGTEIADSCTNVQSIAADYEQVITTLGVTRLDMDVESSSLNNTAGITRRNQAIALTRQWAAANGIPLQIQYTLPVEQYGLDPNGEAVLQNAVANGATVTSVNIMVFDYYIAKEGVVQMGHSGGKRGHQRPHPAAVHLPEPDLGSDLEHGRHDDAARHRRPAEKD